MKNKELVKKTSAELVKTHAYQELKDMAQKFADNIDSVTEDMEKEYLSLLKEGIVSIDHALAFCKSDKAKEIFGDGVKGVIEGIENDMKKGAKFCTCAACAKAKEVVEALTGEKMY